MAKLVKERARKPVIEKAVVFPVTKYEDGELHYGIEIGEPWQPGGKYTRYSALLTRAEAMTIMSEWLKTIAQQDIAAAKERAR